MKHLHAILLTFTLLATLTCLGAPPPPVKPNMFSTNVPGIPLNAPVIVSNSSPYAADFPIGILKLNDAFNGGFNITSFGATNTLQDVTAAIQLAINLRPRGQHPTVNTNTPSGRVHIPAGNWLISSTITVPPGIIIEGDGRDSTVVTMSAINADAFNMQLTQNTNWNNQTGFRDLTIVGPYNTNMTVGAAIRISAPTGLMQPWPLLQNVDTWGFFNGVVLSNSVKGTVQSLHALFAVSDGLVSTGTCNSMVFSDVFAYQCGRHGLNLSSITASSLLSCAGDTCGILAPGDGIHIGHEDTNNPFGDLAGISIVAADCEANTGNGIYLHNPDGAVILGGYTCCNSSNGVEVVGGESVTIQGMRSDAETRYSVSLDQFNGAYPFGVASLLLGRTGGILGDYNHPELMEIHRRFHGTDQTHEFGSGSTGLTVDYSAGTLLVASTDPNVITNHSSFSGVQVEGDNAHITLESGSDPTHHWSRLQNHFSDAKSLSLFSHDFEIMTFGTSANGSGSQGFDILPYGFAGGSGNYSVGIGWGLQQNKATLGVNGGINAGSTNDPGLSHFDAEWSMFRPSNGSTPAAATVRANGGVLWMSNGVMYATVSTNGTTVKTTQVAAP